MNRKVDDVIKHYGVKGMKWDEEKKKAKEALEEAKRRAAGIYDTGKKKTGAAVKKATSTVKKATAKKPSAYDRMNAEATKKYANDPARLKKELANNAKLRTQAVQLANKIQSDRKKEKAKPSQSRTVNTIRETKAKVKQESTNRRLKKSPVVAKPKPKQSYAKIIKKGIKDAGKDIKYDFKKATGTANNNTKIAVKKTGIKRIAETLKKDLSPKQTSKYQTKKAKKPLGKYSSKSVTRKGITVAPPRKTTSKKKTTIYVESARRR